MKIRMKNGRTYRVSKSQGKALIAAGMGKAVSPSAVTVTADDVAPAPVVEAVKSIAAENVREASEAADSDEVSEEAEISPRTGKPKRQYRRRDLSAETT